MKVDSSQEFWRGGGNDSLWKGVRGGGGGLLDEEEEEGAGNTVGPQLELKVLLI